MRTFSGRDFATFVTKELKDKPNPWGIKAYALPESGSGYMYNRLIYYGKETILFAPSSLNQTTTYISHTYT